MVVCSCVVLTLATHLVLAAFSECSINKAQAAAAIKQYKNVRITYAIVCVSTETLNTFQSAAMFLFAAKATTVKQQMAKICQIQSHV